MRFIDLNSQYLALKSEIDPGIQRVLDHGQFILGPEVRELEEKLRIYVGRRHCLTCANGTEALQLVFMALGLGPGDAVFGPDVTFIATLEAAALLGAAPVLVDIDPRTYNIDPAALDRQIEAVKAEGRYRPRAVVAVDFLGNPADYEALENVCRRQRLELIEDAAQSFGAEYAGRKCGAFGRLAATSFFPAKPLGCYGDGGAVFTDDDTLYEILTSLRVHGQGPGGKYQNIRLGLNSRLDTLQAAILLPKLKALADYETEARQKVAARYDAAFAGHFVTPFTAAKTRSIYAQYALLAENRAARDQVVAALKQAAIPTMIYYPAPQHELPVYKDLPTYGETFPGAGDYCNRTFSLPMHPYLEEAGQNQIIAAVLKARP
jgi:dTDP-4-amino-4,6-dideoxygalactose transaminase